MVSIAVKPVTSLRSLPALLCLAAFAAVGAFDCQAQSYSSTRLADGFDLPVGKPDAHGYYVYRGFSPYGHLGEDWNGNGGGNTDEGDPVYSTAHGVVLFSEDYRKGWGNVVIIRHAYRETNGQIAFVDSLYGHLKVRSVKVGQQVTRGQLVGTIGCGPYRMYAAHLHFELRKDLRVGMRRDLYPKTYTTYHSPRSFIGARRKLRFEDRFVRVPINTFQSSNPNRVLTSAVEVPDVEQGTTVRPIVPELISEVIAEETDVEEATPEKSKGIFDRLFGN
ncbi:MAG: M23 family metallopeptidase [Verrucomicrobiales bacterium]|nr:M23 family metallopeptidase [Verrucomicrobiales bacterium]